MQKPLCEEPSIECKAEESEEVSRQGMGTT